MDGSDVSSHLLGRLSEASFDVFATYSDRRGRLKSKSTRKHAASPHMDFVNSPVTDEAIRSFTVRWGPLCSPILPLALSERLTQEGLPWKGDGRDLCLNMAAWRQLHNKYSRMVEFAQSNESSAREELAELVDSAKWDIPGAPGRLAPLLTDTNSRFRLTLQVESLWMALVLMLVLDLESLQAIRRCENALCGAVFVSARTTKKYCGANCGLRVVRRTWWNRKGSAARTRRGIKAPQ